MAEYTQEIIHQFELTKGVPLDVRNYIDKFVEFDTKIPKTKRYPGLITWVDDKKMFYICSDKTSAPKTIVEFLSSAGVKSITLAEETPVVYGRSARSARTAIRSTIYDQLNATNPSSGDIVTVEPLQVSFIYDGTKWRYLSGIYNFTSISEFNIFPNELKVIGNKVLIGNIDDTDKDEYLITNNYKLTQKVTKIQKEEKKEYQFLNDCYYDIDGVLHYYFGNMLYQLGEKILVKENFKITRNTKIFHNLKSSLVFAIFRINSINSEINNIIINPELKYLDDNEVEIQSKSDVEGRLILITNI